MSDPDSVREFLNAMTQELARLRRIINEAIERYPTSQITDGSPVEVTSSAVLHSSLKEGQVLERLHMHSKQCDLLIAKADELTEFSSPIDIGVMALAMDGFVEDLSSLREWALQTKSQIESSVAQLN